MTHPVAQVNGIIKGTFYGTVGCLLHTSREIRLLIRYRCGICVPPTDQR